MNYDIKTAWIGRDSPAQQVEDVNEKKAEN